MSYKGLITAQISTVLAFSHFLDRLYNFPVTHLLVHLRKCILAAATALVICTRANLLFYSSVPQQSHCGRLMAQLFDGI